MILVENCEEKDQEVTSKTVGLGNFQSGLVILEAFVMCLQVSPLCVSFRVGFRTLKFWRYTLPRPAIHLVASMKISLGILCH